MAACGLSLAACGSSTDASTSASTTGSPLQFALCMREHGVSNFPDPTSDGRIELTPAVAQSPAFRSAQQACARFSPKDGGGALTMSAGQRLQALKFARCMRSNGEPDFPDPSVTAPSNTRVLVLHGLVFGLGPGIDPKSPGFRQAATKCGVRPPSGSA